MYTTSSFGQGSSRYSYRLHAIAELVAVLIAGVGQRLVKAYVLAGALTQLVHLSLARRGRQLVSVILLHAPLCQQNGPLPPLSRDISISQALTRVLVKENTLCTAAPYAWKAVLGHVGEEGSMMWSGTECTVLGLSRSWHPC